MKILGVDPGLSGALALIDTDERIVLDAMMMPLVPRGKKGNKVAIPILLRQLYYMTSHFGVDKAYLERAQAMPAQGSVSTFEYGRSFGNVETALLAHGMPLEYVRPQMWKKKARLLGRNKDASRALAMELYPAAAVMLERKRDHGKAEAILIAHYGAESV